MPKDGVEAVKWYRKAAEQEDADAQFILGLAHSRGDGVPKVDVEAVKWFRKAAEQGNAKAQLSLGLAYYYGTGVPKDYVEAYAYLSLAGVTLEQARKSLTILEKEMSQEQIAAGKKRTEELPKEIEAKMAAKAEAAKE